MDTVHTTREVTRKRRKRALGNGYGIDIATQKGRKLKQYVLEEKLDIIDYAKVIGNRAAGREFNVAESSIREWRKNEQRLRSMFETAPERSLIDGASRRLASEDLEKKLLLYIASRSDDDPPLTWQAIKDKANDLLCDLCEREPSYKEREFTINMGWVARFVRRNNISAEVPTSSSLSKVSENCFHTNATSSKNKLREVTPGTAVQVSTQDSEDSAASPQTSISSLTSTTVVSSPRRRRKNFIPRKVINCDVRLGCIPQSNNDMKMQQNTVISLPAGVNNGGSDTSNNNNNDDDDGDDENIDVCY